MNRCKWTITANQKPKKMSRAYRSKLKRRESIYTAAACGSCCPCGLGSAANITQADPEAFRAAWGVFGHDFKELNREAEATKGGAK